MKRKVNYWRKWEIKKWAKEMVKGPRKGRFKANKAQKL
jgi:hypothetical protein